MAPFVQARWFQIGRRLFRWCRILAALTLLIAVVAGIYLNEVGLPDFLKRPFLEKLRQNGVEARFSRMRLRWYRGVVVENAILTAAKAVAGPELSAREAEFDFRGIPFRGSGLKLKSITLRDARLRVPGPAGGGKNLDFAKIQTLLLFPEPDLLKVDLFKTSVNGIDIHAAGNITNISTGRDWPVFKNLSGTNQVAGKGLGQLLDILDQIHLRGRSEANVTFEGDARRSEEIRGTLRVRLPRVETSWGNYSGLAIDGEWSGLSSAAGGRRPMVRVTIDDATNKWASGKGIAGLIRFELKDFKSLTGRARIEVKAATLHSDRVRGSNVVLFAEMARDSTNSGVRFTEGEIRLSGMQGSWGKVARAKFNFTGGPPPALSAVPAPATTGNLPAWVATNVLDWKLELTRADSAGIRLDDLSASGTWQSPRLRVDTWETRLYNGRLFGSGSLDAGTRRVNLMISSELDPQRLAPLLPANIGPWLKQFRWEKPPRLDGKISGTIPAGTNGTPGWPEWNETLEIAAHFTAGRFSFRGIPILSMASDVVYSNQSWFFPDLQISRPEGMGRVEFFHNERSREYRARIFSNLDPGAFRPILETNVAAVLDLVKLGAPPEIRAEIRGHLGRPEMLEVTADIGLTNIVFRGEAADFLKCSLQYSNSFYRVRDFWLGRGGRFVKSPQVDFDARSSRFYFTNVYSTYDPMSVTRAIGAQAHQAVEPYQFAEPPVVMLNGVLSGPEFDEADLHFHVDGGKFHWLKFDLDAASANIHWVGDSLVITNMQGKGYRGELGGWAGFDFRPRVGTDFKFDLAFADIDLSAFMAGIQPGSTNRPEGILHGNLVVTSANDRDDKSYQGYGQVNLRDGLLWEIPIFGVFSPVLNAIIPGLGKSKMREAAGHFTITNSVIYSGDLEIRASAVTLLYRGTVDFQQQVNARVEAEVMKDAGAFGKVVTFVFTPLTKLFEYKVTGTLNNPKTVPLHIPRLLLIPLRPFQTLKELLPEKSPPLPDESAPK